MNDDKILVSIQCLVYNHEPYLRQCLDGFVMQKTNFRFEAIVHDDVSTDGSAAIIREYTEKYPDIIKPIYETENQYSKRDGSLRRIMNAACKGKYIALCEGDDYWIDPLKLQKQVDFLESHPNISYVFTNRLIYTEKTGETILQKYRRKLYNTKDVLAGFNSGLQTACFRRECIIESLKTNYIDINGDRLYPYISSLIGDFACLEDVTAVYRKTGKGVSTCISEDDWFKHATLDFYNFHKTLGFPSNKCYLKGMIKYFAPFVNKEGATKFIRQIIKAYGEIVKVNKNFNAFDLFALMTFALFDKFKRLIHYGDFKYIKTFYTSN